MSKQEHEPKTPEDLAELARNYLQNIMKKQGVTNYQDISVTHDEAEEMERFADEFNEVLIESYRNFEPKRSVEDMRKVMGSNCIMVCFGVTKIDEDETFVSLTLIDYEASKDDKAVYAVASDLSREVFANAIYNPFEPDNAEDEDFEDEEWEEDTTAFAMYAEFLSVAKVLTLAGYEVVYPKSYTKELIIKDENGQELADEIVGYTVETFNPEMKPPSGISVINLVEFLRQPTKLQVTSEELLRE